VLILFFTQKLKFVKFFKKILLKGNQNQNVVDKVAAAKS
jgi:hypothetical protein